MEAEEAAAKAIAEGAEVRATANRSSKRGKSGLTATAPAGAEGEAEEAARRRAVTAAAAGGAAAGAEEIGAAAAGEAEAEGEGG